MKKPMGVTLNRMRAANAQIEAVREHLRRDEATEALRELAKDPNADERELFAATTKIDPWLIKHKNPNRKQRRAHFAKLRREHKD